MLASFIHSYCNVSNVRRNRLFTCSHFHAFFEACQRNLVVDFVLKLHTTFHVLEHKPPSAIATNWHYIGASFILIPLCLTLRIDCDWHFVHTVGLL